MRKFQAVIVARSIRWFSLSALLAVLLSSAGLAGEPSTLKSASAVQEASFDRPRSSNSEVVRFARRPAQVGDQVEQTLLFEMRLTTTLRQRNEVIESNQTLMRSRQRRAVAMTEVDQQRPIAVKVHFSEATKHWSAVPAGEQPENHPEPQPVQGKTYLCRRERGESGKLLITDAAGILPPADEYEIVAQAMDMVGRVNPLAQFLAGRTIAVGETVELPRDVAARVFNLGDQFGEVVRFDLTLQKTVQENGIPCAVFHGSIDAVSNDTSQMRIMVEGSMVVEIDSSRATRISLSGPLAMSETRGTYSTSHQLIGTGQLKMSLVSSYQDVGR